MTMASATGRVKARATGRGPVSPAIHIAWFMMGVILGFLVPYLFTSLLSLHHDLYYLIYFVVTLVFLALYVRTTHVDLVEFFRRNWHGAWL